MGARSSSNQVRLWLGLFVPIAVACILVGGHFKWSATTVAVVIAISAAYLMIPPMVVALQQMGGTGTDTPQGEYGPNRSRIAAVNAAARGSASGGNVRWDPRLTPVLRAFAEALPSDEDQDAVRDLAVLRVGHIAHARTPQNAWQALLAASIDQDRLDAVLDAGADRSAAVAAAVETYRRST